MRIKMDKGYIVLIEADSTHWWEGLVCAELLNRLAGLIPLPKPLDAERHRLNAVQEAVDAERVRPAGDLKPLVKYPVKKDLYAHQVRASNMCLLTFGLVEPFKGEAEDGSS